MELTKFAIAPTGAAPGITPATRGNTNLDT